MKDYIKSKKIKRALGVIAGLLFVTALCGCGKRAEEEDKLIVVEPPERGVTYSFASAEIGDVVKTVKMRCSYKQVSGSEVRFLLSGKKIENVYVKEGDMVKKGQLLCELSVENLEKQIETLEYQVARNELLKRYVGEETEITISGYWVDYLCNTRMTEADSDRVKNRVADLQQNSRYKEEDYSDTLEFEKEQLEALRAELAASRVYAKTNGVVYRLKTNLEGTLSDEDVVLMTIMDTTECLFETRTTEYASYFKEGDLIPMTIKSGAEEAEYDVTPWHMEEWGDVLTFKVVNLADGGDIAVTSTGNINMEVEKKENVLSVPIKAVKTADGRSYVYILGKDDIREVRWVETGFYGDEKVEILSGLDEGEKVILK